MSEQENISVVVEDATPDTTATSVTEPTSEPVKVEEKTTPVTVSDRMVNVPLSVVVRSTNLIDALSRRGSFSANEMAEVGGLYNVLALVVNTAVNQIRAEQVLPKEEEGEVPSDSASVEESA